MDDNRGADRTQQSWSRWRRPLLIVGAAALAVGQWERVSSGKPFAVVTGTGVVCFWVSLLFLTGPPQGEDRAEPDAWRQKTRRSLQIFGFWTIVAWVWLGTAAWLYSVRPLNFVVPAVPTLLTLAQLLSYRNAERYAHAYRQAGGR